MSHTAPDLRACHPKWPHCLWGWHSAFQGQTEKESSGAGESWEGNSGTFRGSKWYSPTLDPVSSGKSVQGRARWLCSRVFDARACPDLFCGLGVGQDCRSPLFEGCSLLVRFKIFPA